MTKIYHRYILKKITMAFLVSLAIFTSVLFIGSVLRVAKILSLGFDLVVVLKILGYLIPFLLAFSIPFSVLAAVLLVFSSLAADNEILALRAAGASLTKIVLPAVLFALLMSLVALVEIGVVSPICNRAKKDVRGDLKRLNPLSIFKPGTVIPLTDNRTIWFENREENRIFNISIKERADHGNVPDLRARWGEIVTDRRGKIILKLYDVETRIPIGEGEGRGLGREKARIVEILIDLDLIVARKKLEKKTDDMVFRELIARREIARSANESTTIYSLAINERVAFALSCIAFTCLGIPLGIAVHRREKSISYLICLGAIVCYYTAMLLIGHLDEKPYLHPEILVFIPNILIIGIGAFLFRKLARGIR